MTLSDWIVKTGPKKVSHMLGVEPATVSLWKNGYSCPRAEHIYQIHQLSKRKVSYKAIVEHSLKNKK